MKTIIIISLISFLTLINFQEPLSKVAAVKAPVNAEKKSKEGILSYEKANFKRVAAIKGLKNIYKVGDVLIGFEDFEHPAGYNSTLDERRDRILGEGEEILAAGTNDKVDIVTLNGTKYLIRKRNKGDEYFYYFMSEDKNRKAIKGRIQFKQKDLVQGEAVLQDFLKGIKFK